MTKSTSSTGTTARRAFLRRSAAVTLAGMVPWPLSLAGQASQRMRTIPSTGETIPVIGLGTARSFDVGPGPAVRAPLQDVLRAFVEFGGTMVDTSPMYGAAEAVVGDLAQELGVVDQLFLATKVWTQGREAGKRQMRRSMELLKTDVIDLMQVHNLVDTQTQLHTMRRWHERGRLRYLGITHYTQSAFADLEKLVRTEKLDYIQFPYSIANRAAEARLLPAAADHGVAVIAHRNFERGALFRRVRGRPLPPWAADFDCRSWGNFFLKYLIADPAVTNVIPATAKEKHLRDNMQAGLGGLPDAGTRKKMVRLVEQL